MAKINKWVPGLFTFKLPILFVLFLLSLQGRSFKAVFLPGGGVEEFAASDEERDDRDGSEQLGSDH